MQTSVSQKQLLGASAVAVLLLAVAVGARSLPWLMVSGAGVLGLVGLWLGLRSPRWLFAGLGLGLVAGQLIRLPVSDSADSSILLLDVALAAYVVGGAAAAALRQLPVPRTASVWLLGAFCLWLPVPLLLNAHLLGSGLLLASLYAVRFVALAAGFGVTAWLVRTHADRRWLLTVLGVAALILLALGYAQRILIPDIGFLVKYGWDPHKDRLLSTFVDPNFFGMFLVMLHTYLLAAFLEVPARRRWLGVFVGLTLLAIILTLSRSAYLALIVASSVVLLLRSWRSWVVLVLGLLLVVGATPPVRDRIAGAFAVDATSQFRIQSWVETLEIAAKQPVVGVGYNGLGSARLRFGYLSDLTGHSAQGTDSSLILILTTTGLVGLALYLGFLVSLTVEAWAVWRTDRDPLLRLSALAVLGIIPAYVLDSQFVNGLFYPLLFVPFGLVAGTVAARAGREARYERR